MVLRWRQRGPVDLSRLELGTGEEEGLAPFQGVSGRDAAVQRPVLPEALCAFLVPPGGHKVQALTRFVQEQDSPGHGVQGLQGGGQHHPEHVVLSASGSQGLGEYLQALLMEGSDADELDMRSEYRQSMQQKARFFVYNEV